MADWISVKDKLPEFKDGVVLVWATTPNIAGECFIAGYDEEEEAWQEENPYGTEVEVSHWMPLPEGPKE